MPGEGLKQCKIAIESLFFVRFLTKNRPFTTAIYATQIAKVATYDAVVRTYDADVRIYKSKVTDRQFSIEIPQ